MLIMIPKTVIKTIDLLFFKSCFIDRNKILNIVTVFVFEHFLMQ